MENNNKLNSIIESVVNEYVKKIETENDDNVIQVGGINLSEYSPFEFFKNK